MEVENLVGLFGMPRSGTTLLTRILDAHVRIAAIYEPWHQNRDKHFQQTDIDSLCRLADIQPTAKESLLIKETTGRAANIELLLRTLDEHRTRTRAAAIVILRSPIETLISHSNATKELWSRASEIELDEENIKRLMKRNARLLAHVLRSIAFYDARIVTYGQLLKFPEPITKDLTALFGYRYAPTQLKYYNHLQRNQGGDREVFVNPKPVDLERTRKHDETVTKLQEEYAQLPLMRLGTRAHEEIKQLGRSGKPLYMRSHASQKLLRIFERMGNC